MPIPQLGDDDAVVGKPRTSVLSSGKARCDGRDSTSHRTTNFRWNFLKRFAFRDSFFCRKKRNAKILQGELPSENMSRRLPERGKDLPSPSGGRETERGRERNGTRTGGRTRNETRDGTRNETHETNHAKRNTRNETHETKHTKRNTRNETRETKYTKRSTRNKTRETKHTKHPRSCWHTNQSSRWNSSWLRIIIAFPRAAPGAVPNAKRKNV